MDEQVVLTWAPGCRLHPVRDVVLIPEGTLELTGPAREVLLLVDGVRSSGVMADALMEEFEGAERSEVLADVLDLLGRMERRGVLRRMV